MLLSWVLTWTLLSVLKLRSILCFGGITSIARFHGRVTLAASFSACFRFLYLVLVEYLWVPVTNRSLPLGNVADYDAYNDTASLVVIKLGPSTLPGATALLALLLSSGVWLLCRYGSFPRDDQTGLKKRQKTHGSVSSRAILVFHLR